MSHRRWPSMPQSFPDRMPGWKPFDDHEFDAQRFRWKAWRWFLDMLKLPAPERGKP